MIYRLVLTFLLFPIILSAQRGSVKGTVTSKSEPLVGVNIFLEKTGEGTVSGEDGKYFLKKVQSGEQRIRFSAVGFETKLLTIQISANKTTLLDVELIEKVIEVDEVKVVDKGVQTKDDTRVSLIQLLPENARVLPGAVTDVFRALQAMPGVLAPNDFSSQMVIRGSGPDQNLIIMDDVEIFNPYRLYGVISMFNPEAVSEINLITGGFSSMYGDRLSAVLDVTNRQGTNTKAISGNINASIVSANLILEGKNPFKIPGSWIVTSRRTYYDLIIEPFVKNTGLVDENVSFPNFHDIQAKLSFGPFDGHRFFLNGILSSDGVDVVSGENRKTPDSASVYNVTDNDLLSFSWHYSPNKNLLNKFVVSWYRNGGDTEIDNRFLDPSLNREDFQDVDADTIAPYLLNFGFDNQFLFRKTSFEDKFLYIWGGGHELDAGAGVDFIRTDLIFSFNLDPQLQGFIKANPNIQSAFDDLSSVKKYNRYRGYLNHKLKLTDRLIFEPGFRYDYYGILRKGYFSPRAALSYSLDDLTVLRAMWGIYYQSPGYEKLRDRNIIFDFSNENTASLNPERAVHYVLGVERWLSSEWRLKFETYYKDFSNLILPVVKTGTAYFTEQVPGKDPRLPDAWTRPIPVLSDSTTDIPSNNSSGESYGFEFLLEKRNIDGDSKLDGWISYAYAVAERNERGYTIPFRFDQRHTLNIVLSYQLNDWLNIGAKFLYGSGYPYTAPIGIKPRITLVDTDGNFEPEKPVIATRRNSQNSGNEHVIFDVNYGDNSRRFGSRRPIYHRLDVRLTADADFWGLDWDFYLDIINIYNRTNVINYDYYITDDLKLGREATSMFPIIPTIGFIVKF